MRSHGLLSPFRLVAVYFAFVTALVVAVWMNDEASAQNAPAAAQGSPQDAEAKEDEELDNSFRKFGMAAGAAYQCTPESEREKLVSDVRHAYSRIGQLFGSDRAFYFAAHFGKATDTEFDKSKCPELMKKIRESVLVRRLSK